MQNSLQFKISSALKNIIGRDLITDDFIAVFELVKNSYDAHATEVEVIFENLYSGKGKIIIKDNGKGMSYQDLIDKWLFVAYSAKKTGKEEDSYKNFRDKIKVKRAYAGAKGIGRFSCDRLGSELYLETLKDEENGKVEVLITDWNKFEEDSNEEFVNVSVLHETIRKSNFEITHGTVLEISNLHSPWNREKLLTLKDLLARLINPSTIQDEDSFKIILTVKEEKENDKRQILKNQKKAETGDLEHSEIGYYKVINAPIRNLIFESLQLKTSYIESDIQEKKIVTTLYEGGKKVYRIEEDNPYNNLSNIHYSIYYLNRSAKSTFTRRMGVQPVQYGHIFVYKNGLRIYPYGERGEDPFKMDNRKAQGRTRYLGTREVIGYISITGDNYNLRETSSRGDGLIKTQAYSNVENQFYETLKKLEKFTIEITDWGNFLSDEDFINFGESYTKESKNNEGKLIRKEFNVNENFSQFISNLTNSKSVKNFELATDILELLDSKSEKSAQGILKSISDKIDGGVFDKEDIKKTIRNVENKISDLKKIKEEAEEEALEKHIENEELKAELDREIANRLFGESIIGREKEDLLSLQHQITHTASNISWQLDKLSELIENLASKENLLHMVKKISLETQKIVSASRFVTKANFRTESSRINEDIVGFINDYVKNIYVPVDSYIHSKNQIEIEINNPSGLEKQLSFRPLEITVLLDNMFLNSRKANATKIILTWSKNKENLMLSFKDNGNGIPEELLDKVFDFKFSTTDGSGIGLYHTKTLLKKYKGSIDALPGVTNGAELIIKLPI